MALSDYSDDLKKIRSDLVTKRRDLANGIVRPQGNNVGTIYEGSQSTSKMLDALIKVQADINALDVAINDEERISTQQTASDLAGVPGRPMQVEYDPFK